MPPSCRKDVGTGGWAGAKGERSHEKHCNDAHLTPWGRNWGLGLP